MSKLTWGPGHLIAERYRLVEPLGRGGMGEVWRAEHATLHAPVAVKLLDPDLLEPRRGGGDDVLARFLREAQAAAALRSPHVVQILDHGLDREVPYMTMELLEGETLADRIDRVGVLPFEQTARIMTHVARAIGKAHEAGIVHRDLKPANIFLVQNDDEELAKVLDFGIAKLLRSPLAPEDGGPITRSGYLVGTPSYMSPEQLQGTKEIDGRSDLWSMAVIAFECVCGRRPFESEAMGSLVLEVCAKPLPVPSRIAGVPPGFDAWWGRAAAREPAARFQSAKELAEALRAVLAPDLAFSGQYRPSAEVVAAATAVGLRGGGAPARDPARPPAPAMGTARAVVSAVQQPSAVRARSQRRAFLAAMALGSLVSAGALVALWRTGHGVAPEPVAPERPAPAAEGAPAAAAEQGAAAPPAAEPAAPAPPEAEPAAPALPAPEPAASAPLAATAAPSATTAAARATSAAPHRPAGPGGTKRKDRLGF